MWLKCYEAFYAPHGWVSSCCHGTESIGLRLVDGPGKCAGRVEIQYEDVWKRVNKHEWTEQNSNTVCKQLNCGGYRKTEANDEMFSQGSGEFLQRKIECKNTASHISDCIAGGKATDGLREEKVAVGVTCESECSCFIIIYVLNLSSSLSLKLKWKVQRKRGKRDISVKQEIWRILNSDAGNKMFRFKRVNVNGWNIQYICTGVCIFRTETNN